MVMPGGRSTSMVTAAMAVPDKRANPGWGAVTRAAPAPKRNAGRPTGKPRKALRSHFTPVEPVFLDGEGEADQRRDGRFTQELLTDGCGPSFNDYCVRVRRPWQR